MKRAFFSLYVLIVVSVITVGWGLDKLLQLYTPAPSVTQTEVDLLTLVEAQLVQRSQSELALAVTELNTRLQAEVVLFSADDLAASRLAESINLGQIVAVNNEQGDRILYRQWPGSGLIISVKRPATEQIRPLLYDLLLIVFYGSIALVVFFWVWPLSRDLRKLEKQTRLIGKDQLPEQLHIHQSSTVYDLAQAFNRMAQRVRNLLASHKEMTYAVSHELRTPLARMKFGLEMANHMRDPERVQEHLRGVRADVTEMDQLINQLLAYAGFEQTEQKLNLQSGDFRPLVDELIQRITTTASERPLEFIVYDHLMGQPVLCEWHLMERALLNLLQNAQRFALSQVAISMESKGGQFVITVDDDGPGIPMEERERVLQSFVRLANHSNAQNRGFGLGLAIVKRIAIWHNGSVIVTSAPLGGARFILSWPAPIE